MKGYFDKEQLFYTSSREKMAHLLECMNDIVKGLNDETAYYENWIWLVPDEADKEDFMDIAEDNEDISEVVDQFLSIINHYCILKDMDED